jgi:hypothetical protein
MRWRKVDELMLSLLEGTTAGWPYQARPIPSRRTDNKIWVPVWVLLLWEACESDKKGTVTTFDPFDRRLRLALDVVGKRGGVNSCVFCSALRLGGWRAVRELHPDLRQLSYGEFLSAQRRTKKRQTK